MQQPIVLRYWIVRWHLLTWHVSFSGMRREALDVSHASVTQLLLRLHLKPLVHLLMQQPIVLQYRLVGWLWLNRDVTFIDMWCDFHRYATSCTWHASCTCVCVCACVTTPRLSPYKIAGVFAHAATHCTAISNREITLSNCDMWHDVHWSCSLMQCIAVYCSVLQCAAMCCSVLQCVAVCCTLTLIDMWHDLHWFVTWLSHTWLLLICDVTVMDLWCNIIELWRDGHWVASWRIRTWLLLLLTTRLHRYTTCVTHSHVTTSQFNESDIFFFHMSLLLNCDVTFISHAKRHWTEERDMRWLWLVGSFKI